MKYTVKSDKETKDLAREFAKTLDRGQVIGLVGDLGAGKTSFTQGLAKALGVKNTVTSPTFVLMKVYKTSHPVITEICHIDAYRLSSHQDLEAIGALEYINSPTCLTVIEWADMVKELIPKKSKIIKIKHLNQSRVFDF